MNGLFKSFTFKGNNHEYQIPVCRRRRLSFIGGGGMRLNLQVHVSPLLMKSFKRLRKFPLSVALSLVAH